MGKLLDIRLLYHTSMKKIARIVMTPGEPAGIGPDLIILLAQGKLPAEVVVIADQSLLTTRAQQLGLPLTLLPFTPRAQPKTHTPGTLKIIPIATAQLVRPGILNPANSTYVLEAIRLATMKTLDGEFDALVTGPVHKGVINEAGISFSGHTEYLKQLTKVAQVVMLLQVDKLRVALATTHLPLKKVSPAITQESLRSTLRVLHRELVRVFGIENPRIFVSGLNPHAGEEGHLGDEEQTTIIPVISALQQQGMAVSGPFSADTLFIPNNLSKADCLLAMYHDQGLPIIKHIGFDRAVNITLGLPIIRVSVDHGTALSLAGSGKVETGSLRAAIHTAQALATRHHTA
jgi:4-hydroxythreonine-4-phosphate dehydrogenase